MKEDILLNGMGKHNKKNKNKNLPPGLICWYL